MPRLITLAVFGMLFIAACTQEEIYTHDPAKFESLESTYQTYLNHYKEPVVAFNLLEKMKTLAIELDNKEYLAKYYSNYAYLQGNENMYGESIKSYLLALSLYTELQDSFKLANSSANLGNIYRLAESPTKAMNYLDKAEKIYVQLNKKHKLPLIYDNLSLVYLGLEQFDKAELYISKSLEAGTALESTYWRYNANASYGELYFRQQRFDEAIKSYEKALSYLEDDQPLEKAYLHGNIGECYMKAGNLTKAEKWLNEALQQKKALDGADKRPNFNYLGELAVLKADYRAALRYYDQAVTLSSTDGELLSKELSKALDALQSLSQNTSARASGLVVPTEKYSLVRDKRAKLQEEQAKLMESMYIQQSVDMAEAAVTYLNNEEEYKHELQEKEQKANLMNIFYAIGAGFGLFLLVFVMYQYRKKTILHRNYKNRQERLVDKVTEEAILFKQQVASVRQMLKDDR